MAYTLPPLINGKAHEWADITVNILGLPSTTLQGIKYKNKQNMKNVKGPGNGVVGRIYGDFNPEGSLSMLAQEVSNFESVAPNGVIQNIPEFDITVTYVDPGYAPITHILKGCRFTENSRESAVNGGEIVVEIELIVGDVKFKP